MSDWVDGRVLYQFHSLGAAGGRGFGALEEWLDNVAALECGGVLLTPVFESSTHGYDTIDPFRIDPRLGDFDSFVAACHRRDMRVVLDGVFNHVGRDFGPFRDVLEHGRGSRFVDWFRLHFSAEGFTYDMFEGHPELVALNHANPEVLDWAVGVANHWIERGADGWRLDAAYTIPRPFLAAFRSRVAPCFMFGEVIHGDYSGFVAQTGLDSVTQYELHKAIWSSLRDANFFELAWALDRHREFVETFAPVTFIGNHDVTRLASQLPSPVHRQLAFVVLLTVPGVPCIYYGDELGWEGIKEHRPGGDDAIRQPLPAGGGPAPDPALVALVAFRRARPWLTRARLEVVEKANRRITYRVGSIAVSLDLDGAPSLAGDPLLSGDGWAIAVAVDGV